MAISQNSVVKPKYPRGQHPNSRANLGPPRWKPGETGNPEGCSLKAVLIMALNRGLVPPKPDAPAKELLIYTQLMQAIKDKDTYTQSQIWERLEGKVTLPIDSHISAIVENRSQIVDLLKRPDAQQALLSLVRALESGASEPSDPV